MKNDRQDDSGVESKTGGSPLVVMMPVCDDWTSLRLLLPVLDSALASSAVAAQIVVVDDGSNQPLPDDLIAFAPKAITDVRLVSLARNLGHQRAIAIGLAWIHANLRCETVVVMDGDGEDDPLDVARLVQACSQHGGRSVIFAERSRRSEGLVFRLAYQLYRAGHWVLVGRGIRFGNFSAVPKFALDRLVHVSELWNHYAAAVLKARLPHVMIPTNRATRLDGKSKMRTVALVTHGLSAISVNGEIVGSRLLMATSGLVGLALVGMIVVLAIRLSTEAAIPGWTTYTLALLFIIFVQAIMAALMFAFVTLNGRNSRGFLPSKDYPDYIMSTQDLPLARAPATGQGTPIRR